MNKSCYSLSFENADAARRLVVSIKVQGATAACHEPLASSRWQVCAAAGTTASACLHVYTILLFCRGDRVEKARLYKASNEACFGVQVATNNIAEGVKAAAAAQAAGASWIDINCGCPIYGEVPGQLCDLNLQATKHCYPAVPAKSFLTRQKKSAGCQISCKRTYQLHSIKTHR